MGCNESKNNVATGNTVSHRPLSKKPSNKTKDSELIPENGTNITTGTNSSLQQPESGSTDKDSKIDEQSVPVTVTDTKDVNVKSELKDGEDSKEPGNKEDVINKENVPGKLVSRDSPDHYFSSRKEGDAVESVLSDEGYYSPHPESVKNVELKERYEKDNTVQEKKELVEEEKTTASDKNVSLYIEKSEDLNAPVLIKEANVVTRDGANVVTTVEDTKNLVITEEHSSVSPPKEPKTD